MNYITKFPEKKTIRLQNYDYSLEGAYFITICSKKRKYIFGKIDNYEIEKSVIGSIVEAEICRTMELRNETQINEYVIMPNHIHMLIVLENMNRLGKSYSVGNVVGGFKASVTSKMRERFGGEIEIWQRGYYEHVVKNENDYNEAMEHIINNPLKWDEDSYNTHSKP